MTTGGPVEGDGISRRRPPGYALRYVHGYSMAHWIMNGIALCGREPNDQGGWSGGLRRDEDPRRMQMCNRCDEKADRADPAELEVPLARDEVPHRAPAPPLAAEWRELLEPTAAELAAELAAEITPDPRCTAVHAPTIARCVFYAGHETDSHLGAWESRALAEHRTVDGIRWYDRDGGGA